LIQGAIHVDGLKVTQRRQCLHSLDGWLLLVDHMTSRTQHDYIQWSHFAPAVDSFSACSDGFDAALSHGRKLSVRSVANARTSMDLQHGAPPPRRQGWISQGYRVVEPNTALAIRARADNVVFATLYAVDASQCSISFEDDRTLCIVVGIGTTRRCLRMKWSGKTCTVIDEG
jgi:hypothetical protein